MLKIKFRKVYGFADFFVKDDLWFGNHFQICLTIKHRTAVSKMILKNLIPDN